MATIDQVRRFAGADPEADDPVLAMCLTAAVEWYQAAGVPPGSEPASLYDLWVANLAAWFYDNRGTADKDAAIPAYIVASVHQMRPPKGGAAK